MAMGWWKPYFFLDPTGVQFLHHDLVIDGSFETLFVSGSGIALLSILDHYAARASKANPNVYISTLYYTIQKLTSGLLMLVMMSFNGLLFLEVVLFGGAAELMMKLHEPQQRNRQGTYQGIPVSEIEMDDC